jgi:multiple sugar transport system substrate-binding protein
MVMTLKDEKKNKIVKRRDFLKLVGTGSAAIGAGAVLAACATETAAPVETEAAVEPEATEKVEVGTPLKGTKIKVLLESFQYHELIKEKLAEFTELTGIEADVELVAFKVALQQIETELSSGSDAYDVVQMIYIKTQRWMRPGWVLPIDDLIKRDSYDVDDFVGALLDAHRWEGVLYSLPYLAESVQMMYRGDKLQEANLQVPQTFDELDKTMAAIHNPPEFYSFVQRTQPAGVHFPFPCWLQGYGGNVFRDPPNDVTPTLNTPEALAAAENFLGLVKNYSIGGTQLYDSPDCQAAMSQGKAGFYIDALGQMGPIRLPDKSLVADKVEIALVPGGPVAQVPSIATHGYAIPKGAKNQEAAWEFIKWAVSKDVMMDNAINGGFPAVSRKSILESDAYGEKYNQGNTQIGNLIVEAIELSQCAYRTVPEFPQVGERMGQGLNEALTDQKTIEEAMNDAQKDCEKIMTDAGYTITP